MNYGKIDHTIISSFIEKYIDVPLSYKKRNYYKYRLMSDIISYSQIELKLIVDKEQDNYLLIVYGYDIPQRYGDRTVFAPIRDCILHLERDHQAIKIHQDRIQYGITNELVEAGISQDKVVKLCPDNQDYVKYAVNLKKVYELNKDCFSLLSSFENPVLKPELTTAQLSKLNQLDLEYFDKAIAKYLSTLSNR